MSVFDPHTKSNHMTAQMFLDPNGGVAIQRYDMMKYPQFDKLTDKHLGFFWRPGDVEITKDIGDFKRLSPNEQHIFTSNLKRQILLDSVQGRSPSLAFGPIVSLPELEAFTNTWTFTELIHSRTYSYIIQNIYASPDLVFDHMLEIQEIVDCAKDISANYDRLITLTKWYELLGEGTHTVNGEPVVVSLYELKKALWLAIMSVNILEGIRFYVSFCCSWAFAENKIMVGNAALIKLICRDENIHLAATQTMLKLLPRDDLDFAKIKIETEEAAIDLFVSAVNQEKTWAKFLFKHGSMLGLSEETMCMYIEFIANKRMTAIGLLSPFKKVTNPYPWTQSWIGGKDMQPAPQENTQTSYIVGGTVQNVTSDAFKGFSLD